MSQTVFQITIGVDIAKKKFDVASLIDGKYKHKTFTNDELGFMAFIAWFSLLCGDSKPLVCMESTELQALVRRVEHLLEMIQMEQNRSETANTSTQLSITNVLNTLETELKSTRKAIKDHIDNNPDLKQRSNLLETIPGIGEACIAHLLLALSEHHGFTDAKQVVAFAGLAPMLRESGQWRGNTHISKTGDSTLRNVLYMPALCAKRHNPIIQVFWDRLKGNGKNGKAIACAAMRKLIHIAFGVIKSGKPFDPNYAV